MHDAVRNQTDRAEWLCAVRISPDLDRRRPHHPAARGAPRPALPPPPVPAAAARRPVAKAILLVLAGHAWGGKDVCCRSKATSAAKVGGAPADVKRRLNAIESRGLIVREPSPLN